MNEIRNAEATTILAMVSAGIAETLMAVQRRIAARESATGQEVSWYQEQSGESPAHPAPSAAPAADQGETLEAPHMQAAFINAVAEEGTKSEAIGYLQRVWNERCDFSRRLSDERKAHDDLKRSILDGSHPNAEVTGA